MLLVSDQSKGKSKSISHAIFLKKEKEQYLKQNISKL